MEAGFRRAEFLYCPRLPCLSPAGLTSEGFLEKCGLCIKYLPRPPTPAVAHRAPQRRVNRWHARQPLVGITWRSWLLTYLPSSRAVEAAETPRPLTALKPALWPSLRGSLPAVTRSPQCALAAFPWTRVGEGEVAAGGGHRLGTGEVFFESESSVVVRSRYCF